MAKRNREDDGEPTVTEETEMMPRELRPDEVEARKIAIADKVIEMLEIEEKRKRNVKKANDQLVELKADMRQLATEARTKVQMVPKQVEAFKPEAISSRRSVQRGRQDSLAAVEP